MAIGAAAGVEVDHWGLSAVRSRLQRSSFLQVRYFGHDQETMLDITAKRRIHADPVAQAFNLRDAFGLDDPDFEFAVDLSSRPLPEPEVVEGAGVTFMFREGSQTLRAAARARDADAGPVLLWCFAQDGAGEAARDAALRATARGEREVVVDSGLVTELGHAPRRLRKDYETSSPQDRPSRLVFQPGPGIPLVITAYAASGAFESRDATVYPFPAAAWPPFGQHDRAYEGLAGAFMPYLAFRFGDESAHGQMVFAPMLDLGTSASENLSALRFWRAVVDSERIGFAGPLFPEEVTQLQSGRLSHPEQTRSYFTALETLFEDVVWLERRLGVDLPAHQPPFGDDEVAGLASAVGLLRDGGIILTLQGRIDAKGLREEVAAQLDWVRGHPPFVMPARETVFGAELDLGWIVGRLPAVHVMEIPQLTGADRDSRLRVLIDGPQDVECRLLQPGESPPSGAIPLSGSSRRT